MRTRSLICWTGSLLLAAAVLPAAGAASVRSVTREVLGGDPVVTEPLLSPRFDKFLPPDEETTVGELYVVVWSPPVDGLPAGTEVVFEFHQQRARTVGRLQIKYPFAVRETRTARFRVAGDAYRTGGPVTAWRVTIRTRGQVTAQHASPTWKT